MSLQIFTEEAENVMFKFCNHFCLNIEYPEDIEIDDHTKILMVEYLGESTISKADDYGTLMNTLYNKISQEGRACSNKFLKEFTKFVKDFSSVKLEKKSSELFYKLLCYVYLSEGRVQGNRLFFQVMDDCTNISRQYTNLSSGSRAEGIDIPMGDYDVMTILNEIIVDKEGSSIDLKKTMLYFDSSSSYPGFVKIKIPEGPFKEELLSHWGVCTKYGPLVSNVRFKEYFMKKYRAKDIEVHGPCLSSLHKVDGIDHLFCLKNRSDCKSRPELINTWLSRVTRNELSVDHTTITHITDNGILFVPIGSKFDTNSEYSLEWRLSFSLLEKALILSWNHAQVLCYTFCKYIKKDMVQNMQFGENLCSYFIKTTLLWIIEEKPKTFWRSCNIFQCLNAIIHRLVYLFRQGNCPHYFIPENNLFKDIDVPVMNAMADIISNLWGYIHRSTHYGSSFLSFSLHNFERFTTKNTLFQERLIALLLNLKVIRLSLQTFTLKQIRAVMKKTLYRHYNEKSSFSRRGLYLSIFCFANQVYSEKQPTDNITNKRRYRSFKDILSHLLIGKYSDAVSGWSLVAMFFSHWHEYRNANEIINFVVEKALNGVKPLNLFTDNIRMIKYFYDNPEMLWSREKSFVFHMNTSCIAMLHLEKKSQWFIQELLIDTGFDFYRVHPVIFAYFLRFVIAHRQGNYLLTEKAICSIIKENRENKIPGFYAEKLSTYLVLFVCYRLLNDRKAADYWIGHAHR